MSTETFLSADRCTEIHYHAWLPEGTPRAVLVLFHGMLEHSARYAEFDAADSFVPHSRRAADLARAREMGLDAWRAELREKRAILDALLAHYNDGRRKTLYCAAAYLLDIDALRRVMDALTAQDASADVPVKVKAQAAAALLQAEADRAGISLKLNKKKG